MECISLLQQKERKKETMIQICRKYFAGIRRLNFGYPCVIQKQSHSTTGGHDEKGGGGGEPTIPITYQLPLSSSSSSQPELVIVKAREGENLMALAHRNDIELEGACEGMLS